jgi:septum formation protein
MSDVDESYPDGLSGEEIAKHIARGKAEAYRSLIQADELVITADTIVWLDGTVMGKPKDEEEAKDMLMRLSGKTHQVITGVCLTTSSMQKTFATVTDVTFAELTEEEIQYYVSNYRPMDKAGAYGIQEWIGYIGVRAMSGSYFNVVGLPIQRLYTELKIFDKL